MKIPTLSSISLIQKRYATGEEPVLVECDNLQKYICKYMRSRSGGYKLTCELIGSVFAYAWRLPTPQIAFVKIRKDDWPHYTSFSFSAPAIGSKMIEGVIDITALSVNNITVTSANRINFLKLALFDLWIANEDRNCNNANLLYDLIKDEIIAIDHGCILNTATYDYPLSMLTSTDSIINSVLGVYLLDKDFACTDELFSQLQGFYVTSLKHCNRKINDIISSIPEAWKVDKRVIEVKLNQLFDDQWIDRVWKTFVEFLTEQNRG